MFTPQAIGFVDSPYKDAAAIPSCSSPANYDCSYWRLASVQDATQVGVTFANCVPPNVALSFVC
jgi:hypothetical protein